MTNEPASGQDSDSQRPPIEVRSPYRPYTLAAKKALSDAVDDVDIPDDDPQTAYVSSEPPADLLDRHELTVVRTDDPVEVWETSSGDRIEIYSDRVMKGSKEATISPEEAKSAARNQDHFTRIE